MSFAFHAAPLSVAAVLLTVPVAAQDLSGHIGGGPALAPTFEGADDYSLRPYPVIRLTYADFWVQTEDGSGLDLNLLPSESINLGVAANYRFGRDPSDDGAQGLREIDDAVEVGAFVQINAPGAFVDGDVASLRGRWLQDVSGTHDGFIFDIGFRYRIALTDRLDLRADITTTWLNSDYAATYYGISQAESDATGLNRIDPSDSFGETELDLEAIYRLTDRFGIAARAAVTRFYNEASASDVSDVRGSPNQFFAGIGAVFSF